MPVGAVLGITWIIGVVGLERDRISSFQLPLVLLSGVLVYTVLAAVRRSAATRRLRLVPTPVEVPPPCVTLHWYGEDRSRRDHPSAQTTTHLRLLSNGTPVPQRRVQRARPTLDYIPLPKV